MTKSNELATGAYEVVGGIVSSNKEVMLSFAGCVVRLRNAHRQLGNLQPFGGPVNKTAEVVANQIGNILQELEETIGLCIDMADGEEALADEAIANLHVHATNLESSVVCKEEHQINDPTVRAQVWGLTGGKCAYCQIDLAPDGYGNGEAHTYCVEHVVPVSYGGPNNIRNYVPSCRSCNNSKGDKHVLTFIRNNLPARLERAELRLVQRDEGAA